MLIHGGVRDLNKMCRRRNICPTQQGISYYFIDKKFIIPGHKSTGVGK